MNAEAKKKRKEKKSFHWCKSTPPPPTHMNENRYTGMCSANIVLSIFGWSANQLIRIYNL